MKRLWSQEPAMILAAVGAVLSALVVPEAWAKVVMTIVPLVLGAATRSQVYAPATVEKMAGNPAAPPPRVEG